MRQHPPWLLHNITYCYKRKCTPKNIGKKQHFLQHKIKQQNGKEVYTDVSKNTWKKVDFVAVFTDVTRRRTSYTKIHTVEMTTIKTAPKKRR